MTPLRLDKSESEIDPLISTPRTSYKHLLARPVFIFAVALTLRLATAAIFLHGAGLTIDSVGFDERFEEGYEAVNISQSLASGHGFSHPWAGAGPTAWITPVMPAILSADMLVFGLHTRATLIAFVIFNELCSALTVFPVFFVARRIAGGTGSDRTAALAAWIFTLNPVAGLAACKEIWYTTLSGLLAALLLWATLAVRDSESRGTWIGYGLLWGAELMTHPSFLVLMPVALLWLVWARSGSKRLTMPALSCLIAVVCCVPWTVRNFSVFHHFVPLRSNFGFELWRYNHDGLPKHTNRAGGAENAAFSSLGEYAYVQEKQREAFAWIGVHPARYLHATAQRVMYFWFDFDHPLRRFSHWSAWSFNLKFSYICTLLVMAPLGLVTIRRKRREYFWLLASFPAIFPLLYYFTLAREFHRFPIDPVLAIMAGFAVSAWLPIQPCWEDEISAAASAVLHPELSRKVPYSFQSEINFSTITFNCP